MHAHSYNYEIQQQQQQYDEEKHHHYATSENCRTTRYENRQRYIE